MANKLVENLAQALTAAAAVLAEKSDSPRLDANVLLCHVLDCPRSFLLSHPETLLTGEQAARFSALIGRRRDGEPVAYITGVKEFWSLELKVTPAVLIPRPETETLVEAALDCLPAGAPIRVADMGTGSGAIALALASERPDWWIIGTDFSHKALDVARGNAKGLSLPNVAFHAGDWYEALRGVWLDMIVSNPPYVAEGDPHLAALGHEPRSALVATDHGLADLRLLINNAHNHLAPGGWLLLEHGAEQGEAVHRLFVAAGFSEIYTRQDLAGLPRVSFGRLPHRAA